MINLFENEKVTKEDFLNVIKDKNYNLSSVTAGILNHNKEINDFCIRKQQQFPFIFKTKFNVFHFIVNKLEFKKCITCGKDLNYQQIKRDANFCSMKCAQSSDLVNEKRKQTSLKKYSVENPWQAQEIKEKIIKTNIKRYGCKHRQLSNESKLKISKSLKTYFKTHKINSPFSKSDVQEKARKTCLEKYGVEYAIQSEEIKEKIKQTCLEKYGVEYICQDKQFKENAKQSLKAHYGVEHPAQSEKVKDKIKQTFLKKYGTLHFAKHKTWLKILSWKDYVIPLFAKKDVDGYHKIYNWKCVNCNNEFQSKIYCTSFNNFDKYIPRCPICFPKYYSIGEIELINFCKQYFPNIIQHDRTLIAPYELDIVIPEIKLTIEFNGNYWHSSECKSSNYHLIKTEMCENKNYRLIHIWEDEWNKSKELIKEKLIQVFEGKEIIDYSKMLDRSWYSILQVQNKDIEILPPELIERNGFQVENCGYIKIIL